MFFIALGLLSLALRRLGFGASVISLRKEHLARYLLYTADMIQARFLQRSSHRLKGSHTHFTASLKLSRNVIASRS